MKIDEPASKNTELEQRVWDLELAIWHERQNLKVGICTLQKGKCKFCLTADKAFMHVEEMLHDED